MDCLVSRQKQGLEAYESKTVFGLVLETANPNPNKVKGFVSSKLLGLFETSYMLLTLVDWAGSYRPDYASNSDCTHSISSLDRFSRTQILLWCT
ncbi:hypothetical protein RHGRI_026712 [Rhododendron griersonianum]|uniref:Uncharacterized protein n=1 Tax=Rhododendron griersonianum TaxID=479676 RepID=A0AAV6IUE1_9ERIC|nr:hypothetical protein RHGRI_026712 [Rhododendron griersonianum]